MTVKKIVGYSLLASPFIAIFVFVWVFINFFAACGIYVLTALLIGIIQLGIKLTETESEKPKPNDNQTKN